MYSMRVVTVAEDGQMSFPSLPALTMTQISFDRPPENLVLESAGVSWIVVSWSLFPGDVLTSSQVILVSGGGTERNITLEGNGTSVNVTGLQSGTEYSFRVIAIASDGQTSTPSAVLTASTAGTLVPTEAFYDTVIGDPLFTVAVQEDQFMCYEIHGHAGKYYNLVSDTCTSVSALFTEQPSDPRRNRMSEIGIYAVSTHNTCAKIQISLENCAGNLNSETVTSTNQQNGISVRQYLNRWRVSVPNCDSTQSLIMWIFCDSEPDMLRFRIARGNNLAPTSHGLLGQFWNIPITAIVDGGEHFVVLFNSTSPHYRRIPAELAALTWDHTLAPCYYVGDSQGGPERSNDPRESVIEGSVARYHTSSLFGTSFFYSKFDESQCNTGRD
ncbi:hypothetical protein GBAR_LOCUS348 [Geodia barretti]|uniref:Fibronectin type-III domain-containing protein n=1 Tax=Geodia barretti TaxID=519541 RepID=A0AA35QS47_GEOBA|nr:hypothetical protein GBAR_LOCUS348 [Geodia barretti]